VKAAPFIQAIDRFLASETDDPSELIEARFRFLRQNPAIRRMICWAGMNPGPMPEFIQRRRGQVLQKFGGDPNGKGFVKFLAALAATDGWFLFRNFYRGPFGDVVLDEEMEERLLAAILESLREK
jgi:hypothetical protein